MDIFTVPHDSKTKEVIEEYNSFIRHFVQATQSSKMADVVMNGFSGCYATDRYFKGHFVLEPLVEMHRVHILHRTSVVLQNTKSEYKPPYEFLFYKSPTAVPGEVRLQMSGRTYALLMNSLKYRGHWPLAESTIADVDSSGVPKFYLSSKLLGDLFPSKGISSGLILFHFPRIPIKGHHVDIGGRDDGPEAEMKEMWYKTEHDNVTVVNSQIGFRGIFWPDEAMSWPNRKREWPPATVVTKIVDTGILIIPKKVSSKDSSSDLIWEMDFSEAETVLFNELNPLQQQTLAVCTYLFSRDASMHIIVKTAFLWSMESERSSLWEPRSSTKDRITAVLKRLESCLNMELLPHYFLEQKNILHDTDIDLVSVASNIHDWVNHEDHLEDVLRNIYVEELSLGELTPDVVLKQLKEKLLEASERNLNLLLLQMYRGLHEVDFLHEAIENHKALIERLVEENGRGDSMLNIRSDIVSFAKQSLSMLYMRDVQTSYFKSEKCEFMRKANECFSIAFEDKNLAFVVHKAFCHFYQRQYRDVVQCLEDIVTFKCSRGEHVSGEEIERVDFHDGLASTVRAAFNDVDVMCTNLVCHVLPGQLSKNLPMGVSQVLGYSATSVSTYNACFVAGYVLALSYVRLGKQGEARESLQKIEQFAVMNELDMNEKRNAAYLNLLADGYIQLCDYDQARYLLERSRKILSNPRNPASLALVSLKIETAKKYVVGGLGIALAAGAAVIVAGLLKPKS